MPDQRLAEARQRERKAVGMLRTIAYTIGAADAQRDEPDGLTEDRYMAEWTAARRATDEALAAALLGHLRDASVAAWGNYYDNPPSLLDAIEGER